MNEFYEQRPSEDGAWQPPATPPAPQEGPRPGFWQRIAASPEWRRLWATRRHTIIYGLVAILLAILCMTLGPGKTLLLVVFCAIGMLIGSFRDGDARVVRLLARFLRARWR